MNSLNPIQQQNLTNLLQSLIDQKAARILIPANQSKPGFWYGGGNMVLDNRGVFWLCGRYRDQGDSRTGTESGKRGLELALWCSDDEAKNFTKIQSWSKANLNKDGQRVISIEGSALHQCRNGSWELFLSTEKKCSYPEPLKPYQKPGTGIWSIDRIKGESPDKLKTDSLESVLDAYEHPGYLHIKDPVLIDNVTNGQTCLIFSNHPFSWTSGNTGLATRMLDQDCFKVDTWEMVGRGPCWDVASTRITGRFKIPALGNFQVLPKCSVFFYDGAECMNRLDQNIRGFKRPRGSSCEELGGAMLCWDSKFPSMQRLSPLEPLFISPWGTHCSRYVDTLSTPSGIHATWQQTQKDGSQPLVHNFLSTYEIEKILTESH